MDFSDAQIAKLVLGYLKLQKSKNAYKEFLKQSPHLKQYAESNIKIGTRIGGFTLVEYLKQYSEICTIIHCKLESTRYYIEINKKLTLVEELLYLLEHINDCRSSTPSTVVSCAGTPTRDLSIDSPSDLPEENINTLALKDLPGYDTSKEKLKNLKNEKRGHSKEASVESDLSILTQTLLEKHELHEVIAENINLIRNSGDANTLQVQNDETSHNNASQAVDSAIKTIMERTESDPIYEKVISEIIGGGFSENKEYCVNESKKSSELTSSENNAMRENFRKSDNLNKNENTIDHYNSEAVQSIVAASFTKINNQQTSTPLTVGRKQDVNNCLNINTGDVILFPGNLDHYIKSSVKTTTTNTSTLTTNNLLMVQPQPPNKSASDSRNVQTLNKETVLSEQDILNMPTIILCENKVEPQLIVPYPSTLPEYITMYKAQSSPKIKNLKVDIIKPAASSNAQLEIYAENKSINASSASIDSKNSSGTKSTTTKTKSTPTEIKSTSTKTNSTSTKTNSTPTETKSNSNKNTPKGESHVRALDFNFPSPGKETEEKNETKSKCVLNLFPNEDKENKQKLVKPAGLWDADLRALAAGCSQPSPPKRKNKKPLKSKKITSKKDDEEQEEDKLQNSTKLQSNDNDLIMTQLPKNAVDEKKTQETTKLSKDKKRSTEGEQKVLITQERIMNLRKINYDPKYPKKCNLNNNPKKETKLPTIKEVKQLEFTGDNINKPTSSQFKLDVNKQKDEAEINEFRLKMKESTKIFGMDVEDKDIDVGENVTPELKETSMTEPIIKKNVLPCLETPVKGTCLNIPKTPGMFSPLNISDTPLTRVFKENLKGVDLSEIPTPKFPLTPIVPPTPAVNDGNLPNRLTDYSTSSSYYQPSDTEENKSLEQFIMDECNKRTELTKIRNEYVETEKVKQDPDKIIADKMKSMKSNRIGSKNLSLMKNNLSELSSSSESEISSSNDDSEFVLSSRISSSDSNSPNRACNNTVIHHETIENIRYPLRSRVYNTPTRKSTRTSSLKTKQSNKNEKSPLNPENKTPMLNKDAAILTEMEKKRQRTISKLNSASKKKANDKKTNNKVTKKPKKTAEKSKKKVTVAKKPIEIDALHSNACSTFYSDEERMEPFEIVETKLAESSSSICLSNYTQNVEPVLDKKSDNESEQLDQEAEKLVTGLKEMGILLVPNNKKTKKVVKETSPIKKPPNKEIEVKQKKRRRKAESPKKRARAKTTTINKKVDSIPKQKNAAEMLLENERRKIDCDLPNEENLEIKDATKSTDNIQSDSFTKSNDNIPLNLNVSSQDIIFDTKTYEEETYSFIYDENKPSLKKISDYNFESIKKGVHASVYLDEIDTEIEKCLLPTPMHFILDIPSKDENEENISQHVEEKKGELRSNKRKASSELTDTETKKSKSAEELLMEIGVEGFLERVYDKQ